MATKLTDTEEGVLVQMVAGFHGKSPRPRAGILVPLNDKGALTAEVLRQIAAIRKLKGIRNNREEPVV